jgi:hypothetical protein
MIFIIFVRIGNGAGSRQAGFRKAGERLRHVYFLNGGVCSLPAVLSHGAIVEAATIGDSG